MKGKIVNSINLDKIINNYDIILRKQLRECKSFLDEFIICGDYFKPPDKELKNLSININNLSNTLKTVLELAIEKEIVIRKRNIIEGEIK